MLKTILGWFVGDTLDRVLDSIDSHTDNETERERIRAKTLETHITAQTRLLSRGPWAWFPLFFIVPLGFWWASICIYSVLWCANCAWPQTWTIAALPPPLDDWAGAIIASLFVGKYGKDLVENIRGR